MAKNKKDVNNINIAKILFENALCFMETKFFRNKKNIIRAKSINGKKFILKIGRIDKYQIELFKLAKEMEAELFFKVPSILSYGDGWVIFEEIEGNSLDYFYHSRTDHCIKACKEVSDSYQKLLFKFQEKFNLEKSLMEGEEWIFSRLNLWSKPIINEGLIDFELVKQLEKELKEIVSKKGINFFGWSHGNIIGDHLIISGKDIFLLDLSAEIRAGNGYYDFLRSMDFMILKFSDADMLFEKIPKWMREYLSEFNESEIRLIFAFRCIGVLGWDIIHNNVAYVAGNLDKKKRVLLKFIKREY